MIQIVILTLMIMIAIVANTRRVLSPSLATLDLCLYFFSTSLCYCFSSKAGRSSQMEQNVSSGRFLAQ